MDSEDDEGEMVLSTNAGGRCFSPYLKVPCSTITTTNTSTEYLIESTDTTDQTLLQTLEASNSDVKFVWFEMFHKAALKQD